MSKLTANALDGILAEMRKMANAKLHDIETDHSRADDLLCAALRILGQNEPVDEWGLALIHRVTARA